MSSAPGELPEKFEEYQLLREVGHGAMGRVYLARDTLLDRPVALKVMQRTTAAGRERFLHEARALARLQHPNVVTVFRVGETRGQPFIVSEYVRGSTLAALSLPVPWRRALELGLGLARGLAAAHRRGVLHRDVKPANAILSEDGTVKLLDFGLAKLLGDELPGPGSTSTSTAAPSPSENPNHPPLQQTLVPSQTVFSVAPPVASPPISPSTETMASETPPLSPLETAASDSPPLPITPFTPPPEQPANRTRAGAVMGTPLYMAPEAWRGEPATPRTDVWALGAVLYELCAGKAPFASVSMEDLPAYAQLHKAVPLEERAPGVDAELARIVACCLEAEPAERYASADGLREALERLAAPTLRESVPEGNPYRGLRAFDREHAALFFGRAGDVGAVLERLREGRWALVTADSGVGKSSLCRAGVLPAVESGALGTTPPLQLTCIPTARPLTSLAEALAPGLNNAPEDLERELRTAPEEVARRVWKTHARGLLLFVDQLEELLTLAPRAEAESFMRALLALAPEGTSRVRLLGTVRSDHFAQLAALPGLADVAARGLFVVAPLALEGLREAVTGPARAKGFGFESPALVEKLAQAGLAGEGALPLLQFTLAELWERRDEAHHSLTQAALADLGGVEGCLARHGDAVLAGLLPAQQEAARDVLLSLVTAEGTRARRTELELLRGGPAAKVALEALVRGRLLAVGEGAAGTTYELAHVALLLHWGTLREWLATSAEQRAIVGRLERAATEWERVHRAPEALLGRRALTEAQALPPERIGPSERALMDASARALTRATVRRWTLRLALPVVLLAATAPVVKARYDRGQTLRLLKAESEQAERSALSLTQEAAKSRREAFVAFDSGKVDVGEEAWSRALELGRGADAAYVRAQGPLEERARQGDGSAQAPLGDVALARYQLALSTPDRAARAAGLERLEHWDADGTRRQKLGVPAELALSLEPTSAQVRASRVELTGDQYRVQPSAPLAPARAMLAPGRWMLEAQSPGYVTVRIPLLLEPGERRTLKIGLPRPNEVPAGFIYVPPGRSLYGSMEEDGYRRFYLNAEPLHSVENDGFFIAKYEVTFAQWMEYLRALTVEERAPRLPRSGFLATQLALDSLRDGRFQLSLVISGLHYRAVEGEQLRFPGRATRQSQAWTHLPVSAISFMDAQAYVTWLAQTGRVPHARLCTEHEWERAARGADDRTFPAQEALKPEDAAHDVTYGRTPNAFGPDEVGSHPGSSSPFGVEDLAGNVWELVQGQHEAGQAIMRGGSWYQRDTDARVSNREPIEPGYRDPLVGLRLCATPPRRLLHP